MVDSISKEMIIFSLLLILALQLKGSEIGGPIIPTKVTVEITNRLNMKILGLRCQEKHRDMGVHILNVGETYSFRFYPNYLFPVTLYFCHFKYSGGDHHFDIYVQRRDDYCFHNRCSWEIVENGPCKIKPRSRECFNWNVASVPANK
ncbi:hypothetical protein VNO80_14086 [Phaseolus coccineus]|uniref:S-protein homolog n=1 Tax=Phaseolus coccineus TaxID=3886 RepID=A0AAN9R7G7_PHACN